MIVFKTRWLAVAVLVLTSFLVTVGVAHAGDADERAEIQAFFLKNFASADYAALDDWYGKAIKDGARLSSGVYRANRLVRSIGFGDLPNAPSCTRQPCSHVNDAFWERNQQKAKAWLEHSPRSTLAAITLARAYSWQAWEYRGSGYANTVSDEDMNRFLELNHLALRTLFAIAEQGRKDPNWWAELLLYALYGQTSREDYAKLTKDAIAAFPHNHDIYFAISVSLLPQWGGSYKAIADLAALAVENTKTEQGQTFYARIYWSVYYGLNHKGAAVFNHPEVNWSRIRAGFEDLVKRYPDNFNLNYYARLACVAAQDKKTTADVLRRIGNDVVPDVWNGRNEYVRCKNWSRDESS